MKWRQILSSKQFPWVLLGAMLLPFFVLAFFTFPVSDDYAFFADTQTRSFTEFLNWGYTHLSGRYTAIAVTKLFNPLSVQGFWLYRVFVILIFLGFTHSAYLFLREGAKRLGIEQAKLVAGIMLLYWWLIMPNTAELVYWYSSAFSYTIGLIGLLYWGYFLMKDNKILVCLLPLVIAGTCELAAILLLVTIAILFTYPMLQKVKIPKYYYALLTVVLVALVFGLLSPGNFHRTAALGYISDDSMHLIPVIASIFYKSFNIAVDFFLLNLFTLFIVVILAIATPGYSPSENVKKLAKYMLWGSVVVIPLLLSPYCLPTGIEFLPLRIVNYCFIACSILYIPALFIYYKPYFSQRWYGNRIKYGIVFITLLYVGARSNLRYAVTDLVNINTYVSEVKSRYTTLEKSRGKEVEFSPLTYMPNTILHADIDQMPGHWYNRSLAKYYGVKSIALKK